MPVYESIKNADNKIAISAQNRDSVVFGWDKVVSALAAKGGVIAIDGWYGIDFGKIAEAVAAKVTAEVVLIPAVDLYKSRQDVIAYNQPYVTDDPGFGKVNTTGVIEDIMADDAIQAVKDGKIQMTVMNRADGIAAGLIEDMEEYFSTGKVESYNHYTELTVIDPTNVDQFIGKGEF